MLSKETKKYILHDVIYVMFKTRKQSPGGCWFWGNIEYGCDCKECEEAFGMLETMALWAQ